jgi:hypothetical protein
MRDVAHASGVSYQTVSRVINDHERVHPETRARVLAAVEALGYHPNSAAPPPPPPPPGPPPPPDDKKTARLIVARIVLETLQALARGGAEPPEAARRSRLSSNHVLEHPITRCILDPTPASGGC